MSFSKTINPLVNRLQMPRNVNGDLYIANIPQTFECH